MSVFYYKYTEDGGIQKIHKSTLKGIKRCKIANNDTGISRFFPIFFFLEKNRNVERLRIHIVLQMESELTNV